MRINVRVLLILVYCLITKSISAQNVSLKYGIYKITDGGSVYNSGMCGSYNYTNPVTHYWFKPGMTLSTIESNFCGGIRDRWNQQAPVTGPCSIMVIDNTHFSYSFSFTLKCKKDNTSIISQGYGLVSLFEEIPVDPKDPDPGLPFFVSVSNKIKGFTPEEQELWSGSAEDTPPVIKICADGSRATWIKITKYNPEIPASAIHVKLESDLDGARPAYTGSLTVEELDKNSMVVVFKHPGYLPPPVKSHSRPDKIIITYGDQELHIPIEVYRAPVIMVHGLWSDASSFLLLKNKLISENLYPGELI
jgi:hypothetical protein